MDFSQITVFQFKTLLFYMMLLPYLYQTIQTKSAYLSAYLEYFSKYLSVFCVDFIQMWSEFYAENISPICSAYCIQISKENS